VNGNASVQLATYPGDGSRYVRHRDASPSSPHRRLTAIYYANSTHWDPSTDGGSLRIYGTGEGFTRSPHHPATATLGPSALPAGVSVGVHPDGETYVDVAPCGDRLLVFLSHLEHEVSVRFVRPLSLPLLVRVTVIDLSTPHPSAPGDAHV